MNSSFYIKLSITNLKHNKNVYIPFLIACVGTVFTYFVFLSIYQSDVIKSIPNSVTVESIFMLGKFVISIFSVLFIFYANSFLIKRRMKEIGLYSILGLEKRHIAKVIAIETLILYLVCILISVIIGAVFGNLSFLVLMKFMHIFGDTTFTIPIFSIIETMIFFFGVFTLTFIYNVIKINGSNSITLLRGEVQGEREPKTPIFMTLVGIITLGLGYYIALTTTNMQFALTGFLNASLLVICGTYALFTSGSITLLKMMKKNKKIFYSPRNFISISNMIYRMKKNAVGLANICIFSTIVIVVISTTLSLYMGRENMLRSRNPFDLTIVTTDKTEEILPIINTASQNNNITIKNNYQYRIGSFTGYFSNNTLFTATDENEELLNNIQYSVLVIPLEDYNQITGEQNVLSENELLLHSINAPLNINSLHINNIKTEIKYNVKGEFDNFVLDKLEELDAKDHNILFIIADSIGNVKNILSLFETDKMYSYTHLDIVGEENDRLDFANNVGDQINQLSSYVGFSSVDISGYNWYSMFGGLLFLGIFLGFLFMIALVLIIYFKQVSEGYEDHNRFTILQKVGMSKNEVQETINKQIRLVFFMPLFGAILHMIIAYSIICNVLLAFSLTDNNLIFMCILGVTIIFSMVYVVIYSVTTKVYYKLVQ